MHAVAKWLAALRAVARPKRQGNSAPRATAPDGRTVERALSQTYELLTEEVVSDTQTFFAPANVIKVIYPMAADARPQLGVKPIPKLLAPQCKLIKHSGGMMERREQDLP